MNKKDSAVLWLNEESGKDFLRALLRTEKCVPFIGAGFTAGEPAFDGIVPSGKEFMSIMRSQINESTELEKPSAASLNAYEFQELADEYFREPIVDFEKIKDTLKNNFTNVDIKSEAKRAFLRWDWDYFYTLNIDDAIEREVGAIKVLPFTSFSQHNSTQFVYKLHGDAADAVTAASQEALRLVFGNADYIKSLTNNRSLLSTLSNDLVERNLLFVGCSLSKEIDILFSLAGIKPVDEAITSTRVYVTATEPTEYESKKKLRQYGITHVLVVEYAEFYAFVGSVTKSDSSISSHLAPYVYSGPNGDRSDPKLLLQYILQIGWNAHDDPGTLAVSRDQYENIKPIIKQPITVIWGRRFSGKTTLLFEILRSNSSRRTYFISSSASASDKVLNSLLRIKDSLIAVDTDALSYQQIQLLVRKVEQIRDNNTSIIIATNRGWLTAVGPVVAATAIEVVDKMSAVEAKRISSSLEPLGLSKTWRPFERNLDNIYTLSDSPIAKKFLKKKSRILENIDRLHQQWTTGDVGRLEFSTLFYLAARQKIYSRYFRELANDVGLSHMSTTHFYDFARQWQPFVELEQAEASSMRSERSTELIVSNANAWIHYTIRRLSLRLGSTASAKQIVKTFLVMNKVEDKAFELLMFDNLNIIYSEEFPELRSNVIREVYEG